MRLNSKLLIAAFLSLTVAANAQSISNGGNGSGSNILAKSGVAVSYTGGTSEQVLATIPVPANTIGANGSIFITTFWTITNSVNIKTPRVRLGAAGTAGSVVFSNTASTIAALRADTTVLAGNATNVQNALSISPRGTDLLTTENTINTTAVDMTVAQNLVITGQLATSSETITLLGYVIRTIQ